MSESDNSWNAGREDPAQDHAPTEQHPDFSWPENTWPPAPTSSAPASPSASPWEPPAMPAAAPGSDPGSVSWPPTRPSPTIEPTASYPAAAPPTWPPATAVSAGPPPRRARRGLAALAALALVLASAGVGAGVAIAVHKNSNTQTFTADPNGSFNNGNGSFGNGGFGNQGGDGTNGLGGGTSLPSGSGTLDTNAIAAKINPALVDINTTLAQGRAAGTGMIISSTGEILTNNHVIADATSIKVTIAGTGPTYNAKVVGYDITEDVALVQITDKVSNLPTVTIGDPSKVQVGDPVVAIGNALGKGGTPRASQGQVTRLDQEVTAGDEGGNQETLEGMIQINAPIQPGDSGGALVNSSGAIIGMNTAAAGGGQFNSQSGSNVGFAIPIDHAMSIVNQIRTGKDTDKVHIGDRALLGVNVQDLTGQSSGVTSGALVVGVQAKTGAADAGIQNSDIVVSLNGQPVTDSASLRTLLVTLHPGDSVKVGWVDTNGTRHDANVKLTVGPPL